MLFLVIRPLAVFAGLAGTGTRGERLWLIGWFGVRGVGSIYYLSHAVGHGLPDELARTLAGLVLWPVVVHGVSVTPLMDWYAARRGKAGSGSG